MRLRALLLAGLFSASLAATAGAQEVRLRLLHSWPTTLDYIPIVGGDFKELVESRTNGRIKISMSGPEAIPPFQQFEPLKSGIFDILLSSAALHPGEMAIGLMADAMDPDPVRFRESGAYDIVAKRYLQKHKVHVLGIPSGADDAFQLLVKEEVDPKTNLDGKKIRGTSNYHGVIKALGGVPVVMPTTETYTALQKGVIDGSGQATIGVVGQRWYEVTKAMGRPAFGSMRLPLLMSDAAWTRLTPADRKLLMDIAQEVELRAHKAANALVEKEAVELKKRGMGVSNFGIDKSAVEAKWEEGLWELTEKHSKEDAKIWRDFLAKQKILRSEVYAKR